MLNKVRSGFFARRKSKDTKSAKERSTSSTLDVPVLSPGLPKVLSISPGSYSIPHFPTAVITEKQEVSTSFVIEIATPTPTTATFSTGNMTSTPPHSRSLPELALSVYVLLPTSAHLQAQHGPIAPIRRPPPLTSRQSGSSLSTMGNLKIAPQHPSTEKLEDTDQGLDIPDMAAANRRLSLAPGIGAGTQTRSTRMSDGLRPLAKAGESSTSRLEDAKPAPPPFGRSYQMSGRAAEAPAKSEQLAISTAGPPAFGSRSGSSPRTPGFRRRPNTATVTGSEAFGIPQARGSMALPHGMGLGIGAGGRNRPGWEADEVVGMLRNSGMEVTVIRNSSHLPAILTSKNASPTISSFAPPSFASASGSKGAATPVILVPLCDSPSLPSLSLLLSQSTTTTAVCFQQDVLDRARRTEEEWLPSALKQIKEVMAMREQALSDGRSEKSIVIAYSANPALSSSTVAACVDAGASGVIKPPYSLETAALLKRIARAAQEGRISSVVHMPTSDSPSPISPILDDIEVVLPPTALLGGGQHEGERVLNAHRRKTSGQWENQSSLSKSRERSASRSGPTSRKQSRQEMAPLSISTTAVPKSYQPDNIEHEIDSATYALYQPSSHRRRRSVDVGGLATAMKRAQKAFDGAAKPVPIPGIASPTPLSAVSRSSVVSADSRRTMTPGPGSTSKLPEAEPQVDEVDTHLAELIGAMYYQTCLTIDVQMAEYAELSAPLDSEDRARLIDALATWDFKPHRLDENDLYRVACLIFEAVLHIEGVKELALDREQINRLLFAIRAIYHAPNPYHNYIHAIDVLQATYTFLLDIGVVPPWSFLRDLKSSSPAWKRPDEGDAPVHGLGTRRAREVLRPQDVLAVVVAAMGHDVGHPGLSNAFMKNAKTPLSEVYDDKSVLENMHCMLVIQLMRKHGFGFLISGLDADTTSSARGKFDSKGFRRVLYSSVLATDMSLHFAWIAQLKAFGERVEKGEVGIKGQEEMDRDRIMLCQSVIKCADISNPTRPIDVSEHWSTVLLEEWAKQASLETDLSLPVSVVASADQALQAKGQIGFIDLFTQPLFEAVSDVVPELQRYADSCAENRGLWSRRLESLQGHESTPLVQPVIAGASVDDRFRTLFPLSLPMSLVSLTCLEPGPIPDYCSTDMTTQSNSSSFAPATPVRIAPLPLPNQSPHSASSFSFGNSSSGSYSPTTKAMRAVYHANLLDQRHKLAKEGKGVPIPGVNVLLDAGRRASTPDTTATSLPDVGRFDRQYLKA